MFRFADPNVLYLLIILPFVAIFYFYSNYRRTKRLRKYGDPELLSMLMPEASAHRPVFKFWVLWIALGLSIVMLASPQFGTRLEKVKRSGIETIIALDILSFSIY